MTQAAHTPLRLNAGDETTIMDWGHSRLCTITCGGTTGRKAKDAEQIAATMVARWNALEGIPDPSVVGEAIEALRWIYANPGSGAIKRSQLIRPILAKLEGGAA